LQQKSLHEQDVPGSLGALTGA